MEPLGTLDVDMFLDETGNFGRFEILTYALLSISIIYSGFTMFSYSFTSGIIYHRCMVPECENKSNLEYEPNWVKRTMDFKEGALCKRYKPTAEAKKLKPNASAICHASWFDKKQTKKCNIGDLVYQFDDITIMHEFDLQCDGIKLVGLVGTLHNTGQAIGYPVLGMFSDKFGRKPTLIISTLFTIVFGFLHLVSQHYYDFILYEVLMGYFVSGVYVSGYILGIEIVGKKVRTIGGVFICTFFTIGLTLLGVIAMFVRYWRIYAYIHLPFLICIVYLWLLIESPRWLKMKRKEKKLKNRLIKIAKCKGFTYTEEDLEKFRVNREAPSRPSISPIPPTPIPPKSQTPVTENEDEKPPPSEETDSMPNSSREENVSEAKQPKKRGLRFGKLLHSRVLFPRLLNCYYCWITSSLVYGGLQLAAVSVFGNRHVNFILSGLVEVPAYILTPILADRIGRRSTLSGCLILCGSCNLSYPFLSKNFGGTIVYFIGKFAATISYAVIYIFTAELFPTEMRHTIMGTCGMISRIGSVTAPQWQVLNNLLSGLPFFIFAFTCVTSAGLIFFLPETLHKELADSIEEAEQLGKKRRRR